MFVKYRATCSQRRWDGGGGAQSQNVHVCPESLSCFRRAIEGHHYYCSEGPEGPGMTAAHPGWPALEGAARRKNTIFSLVFRFSRFSIFTFSRIQIDSTTNIVFIFSTLVRTHV